MGCSLELIVGSSLYTGFPEVKVAGKDCRRLHIHTHTCALYMVLKNPDTRGLGRSTKFPLYFRSTSAPQFPISMPLCFL